MEQMHGESIGQARSRIEEVIGLTPIPSRSGIDENGEHWEDPNADESETRQLTRAVIELAAVMEASAR